MQFADVTKVKNIMECVLSSGVDEVFETVDASIKNIIKCNACISEDKLFELKVILNELLNNALKHGNKGILSKKIRLTIGIDASSAIIAVEDEGEGFDFNSTYQEEQIDLNNFTMNGIKECGRGIMIIAGLCDEISFNNTGNRIEVRKFLN